MKKIIVVGYPKSGNTWLSRLTAELVGCPVEGFLYSDHKEIAVEGEKRKSEFKLYKSHHQLHELTEEDGKDAKLIYVVRDPRDIAISGRTFFLSSIRIFKKIDFSKKNFPNGLLNKLKAGINVVFHRSFGKGIMRKRMNDALLNGNEKIHHWCRISWKTHMDPYAENPDVLMIKYESVLEDPFTESKKILDFLDVQKDDDQIRKDIDKQSFANRKKQFLKDDQAVKAKFLRKGKGEQWKTVFSEKEKQLFVDTFKEDLLELNYSLD